MATITTQYAVGDDVFFVATISPSTPVACAVCSSTGSITLAGSKFLCPACGGQKKHGLRQTSALPAKVLRVQASQCTDVCTIRYWLQSDRGVMQRLQSGVFATEAAALASIGG